MKKSLLAVVLLLAVSTTWAADMKGKVGFGIGQDIPGGDLLSPSYFTMRAGLTSGIVLAPEVFVMTSSNDSKIDSLKTSTQDFGLNMDVLLRVLGTPTTNVYCIVGAGFSMDKYTMEDYTQNPWKQKYSGTQFGFNLGLGLEHFVTNTLAVNLNTLSGFSTHSSKTEMEVGATTTTIDEDSGTSIGLKNIDCRAFVIWYVPFM